MPPPPCSVTTVQSLDRRRPIQPCFQLLAACMRSSEPLVRHTSLLALCDGLAGSDALQAAAYAALPLPQRMLVSGLLRVLYPGELSVEGSLSVWQECVSAKAASPDASPAVSAGRVPALPDEWRRLVVRLLWLQRSVHPSVALGPLITLLDV